jgi:hypothetical protein
LTRVILDEPSESQEISHIFNQIALASVSVGVQGNCMYQLVYVGYFSANDDALGVGCLMPQNLRLQAKTQ